MGSSGGLFGAIANNFIGRGYDIVAASWKGLKVVHQKASNKEDLQSFYKSKYVLSDTSEVFPLIRESLNFGKNVLFVGTPCQCSSVKNYFSERDIEKIILIDFLCHGCPSQKFFDLCLSLEDKKLGIEITSFTFRAKTRSFPHSFKYTFIKNGMKKAKSGYFFEFPYYAAFCNYKCFIDSCYICPYKRNERVSDLTIGDAWQIEKISRSFKTKGKRNGCSLAIINTPKGDKIFNSVTSEIIYEPISLGFISNTNPSFSKVNTYEHVSHDEFFKKLCEDFDGTIAKNFSMTKMGKIKAVLSLCLNHKIVSFAKKISNRLFANK